MSQPKLAGTTSLGSAGNIYRGPVSSYLLLNEKEITMKLKTKKKIALMSVFVLGAFLVLPSLARAQDIQVDPNLPQYQSTSGVSGNLNSVGSDTLNNLMTYWAEDFKAIYPNVNIQIEGKGSSTAPPALMEGTSQLGPMSRPMKSKEKDDFEAEYGYKPTEIRVAIDALAVFVHKDNPIQELSTLELDNIFSSTLKMGGEAAETWGDVGLSGEWATRPISLYGRNSASGTYGFFKEKALVNGDYKSSVKEQPGSSAVVQGIASDLGGIGYSGIGYLTSGVKTVALGRATGPKYAPTMENAVSGNYPLARFLYVYVNKKPGEPADKLTQEFLKFVLSKKGQEIVVKDGYFPLPDSAVEQELAKLQ